MIVLKIILVTLCLLTDHAYSHAIKKNHGMRHAKKHGNAIGIAGGHSVSIEKVPYMALLRYDGKPFCGASIIHEQFILTTATCFWGETIMKYYDPPVISSALSGLEHLYKVSVGTDQIDEGSELLSISKIIVHEKYTGIEFNFDFDICIIKLNDTLKFGNNIDKINLPHKKTKVPKHSLVTVTGWGYTGTNNGTISSVLIQGTTPLASKRKCQRDTFDLIRLTPRMFCALNPGIRYLQADDDDVYLYNLNVLVETCLQDGRGGPLTFNDVQIGIVSLGVGLETIPGFYTKVKAFLPWIHETIERNK